MERKSAVCVQMKFNQVDVADFELCSICILGSIKISVKKTVTILALASTFVLSAECNFGRAQEQPTNQVTEKSLLTLAEKGDVKSQKMLGMVYWEGLLGVSENHKAAIKWFSKAAESGDVEAKSLIGRVYLSDSDFENAAKWLKQAAEAGDLTAQTDLGQFYLKGVGVPKDEAEGIKWTRKAAEKGDSTAQYNLGVSYRDGLGVEKDQKKADEWFAKAKKSLERQ
jgi:TPR repeat protein